MDRHHNQPPLADRLALDHADLVKEATEAAALVPSDLRAIESDEEAASYTDTAADMKAVLAQAVATFKAEKEPWLEGGRTVDAFFNAIRGPLDTAIKRVVSALDARANAILAAKRKADAEAAEKARREAVAFDEPVAFVAPTPVKDAARVVSIATGNKASVSTKWRGDVVDIEKLPRHYMIANQGMIDAAIKGGIREIPGVHIYEVAKTAIRR